MKRVVVTGLGIVSCLGSELRAVEQRLHEGRPATVFVPEYAALGLRSQVACLPDMPSEPAIPRKQRRFMGDAAQFAWHALHRAIADAGLPPAGVSHPRTGLVVGSGVGSPFLHSRAIDALREGGVARVPPYTVPQVMGSTTSANLATAFGILGASYSITSACASSAHCIGHAAELIQLGRHDVVFAGGAEEVQWTSTMLFDAMGALSTGFNATPAQASRPYDRRRDGFVISGGAGILVLEEERHALGRGARIYAELSGYGATSDGEDMVLPGIDGAARAMRLALEQAGDGVDYINAHATSTPLGDIAELDAIARVFGSDVPPISSTKGLTGHAIAASGVQEAIFALTMLNGGFLAANANLDDLDPAAAEFPLVRAHRAATLEAVMTNSFGFGGTNACLVFRSYARALRRDA